MIPSVIYNVHEASGAQFFGLESPWMSLRSTNEKDAMRSDNQSQTTPETVASKRTKDDMERMYFRYQTVAPVGVEFVSDAFARALGYSTSALRNDRHLLVRLAIDADRKRLAAYLSSAGPARPSIEVGWRSRSSGILHLVLNARTVQTEDGRVVALDVTVRPVVSSQSREQPHLKLVQRLSEILAIRIRASRRNSIFLPTRLWNSGPTSRYCSAIRATAIPRWWPRVVETITLLSSQRWTR